MQSEAVVEHIVNWMKNYAEQARVEGFVIGISGGIDSAVTSSLCARTGLPTLCVALPIHQAANQMARGEAHISLLKATYENAYSQTVDLTSVFDSFVRLLPAAANADRHEFSLVNTRARFRMSTLYYFAGLHNYLVAGTGNKVEDFGVGFYTKYGDGGVDISPIADLNKTDVYDLGKVLGISKEIMQAPPTDGLWGDDRTDEDQIGASYPELEWAMEFSGDPNLLEGREKEVHGIYHNLHRRNRHKMVPIPVCKIPPELKN